MDFESRFEIARTAEFIHDGDFTRVALQFPDELLKDSVRVVSALRDKIGRQSDPESERSKEKNGVVKDVSLYVMADTAYGSCCVDEVGASHAGADCVVHYGHTCLSPTTKLPAFFVFGKASIDVSDCIRNLFDHATGNGKPVLVLYGLEYAHSIYRIRKEVEVCPSRSELEVQFAKVKCSYMNPSEMQVISNGHGAAACDKSFGTVPTNRYSIGGLIWELPKGHKMEEYFLFWIGSENSAFVNIGLTFNSCVIVRYDATANCMVTDISQQRRMLKRRYYLVEKAKDAKIVGVLVGTLGVAGYLHMIHQMNELITASGKKAYTLVVGRPNPAKLANFPECDIFVYVSCAQTALLDSKEFLAPVITPFEAMLAFNRGSQWTGAYIMEFGDLINSHTVELREQSAEARFSFLQGAYVDGFDAQENGVEDDEVGALFLANATEKALQLHDISNTLSKRSATSGAEFLAARTYQGLDMHSTLPEPYVIGRRGRAAGYEDEKKLEKL